MGFMPKPFAYAPNYLSKDEKALLIAKKKAKGLTYEEASREVRSESRKVFWTSHNKVVEKEVDKVVNKNKNFKESFKQMVEEAEAKKREAKI
jgi:hypothetical protein